MTGVWEGTNDVHTGCDIDTDIMDFIVSLVRGGESEKVPPTNLMNTTGNAVDIA